MLELSAGEVLVMGVDLERNAKEFYAHAAQQIKDEAAKMLLARLSRMEAAHEERLQSWREELSKDERSDETDRIAEAQVTLSTLAMGPFLQFKVDPNIRLKGGESAEEILEIAVGFEENAIALFTAMINLMPPAIGREKVEALRAEEHGHRQMLREQLVVCRLRSRAAATAP